MAQQSEVALIASSHVPRGVPQLEAGTSSAKAGEEEQQALPTEPLNPEQELKQRRQVIASSIIGNVLEWYDFLCFAYQSVVISKLFFPNSDPFTRALSVWGIFAAGFITRPLGALFFGWIGDRYSRKTALLASIYTMSIPTFIMGCLPTYATVGRLAPWLLVLARVVQGFAVGGEFTSTMVFLVEHSPPGQAGLQGSWAFFSVMVGVLCGSGVSMLFNYVLSDTQLYAWGWRVPFLISILGAGVGAYMRRNVHEPPSHQHHYDSHHGHHVGLLSHHHQHHDDGLSPSHPLRQPLELDRHSSGGAGAGAQADAARAEAGSGGLSPGTSQNRTAGSSNGAWEARGDREGNGEWERLLPGQGLGFSSDGRGTGLHGSNGSSRTDLASISWAKGPGQGGGGSLQRLAAWTHMQLLRPPVRAAVGAVTVFMIDFLTAVGFYLTVIFLPTYLQAFGGLTRRQAISVHTWNMVLYMLLIPVGGYLSDRVGRVALLVCPGIAMAGLAYPLWHILGGSSVLGALEGQGGLCVIMALFNGALPASFVYLFHPKYRCTGVSVGHNISMALCGGTAPLIATALMKSTGDVNSPAYMLIAAGVLTALGGIMARVLFGIH